MKHFAKNLLSFVFITFFTVLPLAAQQADNEAFPTDTQEEEEILIELQGPAAQSRPAPILWDYNARQLTNKWRGKTREQLLYTVPVVSDRDGIVRGAQAEYMLVEYFSKGQFRKFLFRAETPQTFVAVAATPADVLAINKKYKINIGLPLENFEAAYAKRAILQNEDILPKKTVLYQLSYTDVNTPKARLNWFLFENGKLTQTFYTRAQKDAYLQPFKEQHKTEPKKIKQPEQEDITPTQAPVAKTSATRKTKPFKAVLSGGTTQDKIHSSSMNPSDSETVLKTLQGK